MKTTIRPTLKLLLAGAALVPLLGCGGDSFSANGYADLGTSVAVLDVDGNGRQDVLTSFDRDFADGRDASFISARLGQGTSGLNFGAPIRSAGGVDPGPITAIDLNADGHPDLVLCNAAAPTVTLLYGSATPGVFGSAVDLQLGANRYAYAVAVADFNGDGKPDIAVAASGGTGVLLFLQNAGGGFSGVSPISIAVSGTPYCIATAVLETGGHQDLAVGLSGGQLAILKGNGDGTFQAPVNYACGTTPAAIKIADLDGANGPDIAVADYAINSSVIIFLNNGTGAFAAGVAYPTGDAYATDLAIGDLNGDGKLDIAVANAGAPGYPGSLAVMFNNGSGALGAATLYQGLYGPLSVAIADIDGDGKNDLISADGTGVVRLQDPANPGLFLSPVQLYY